MGGRYRVGAGPVYDGGGQLRPESIVALVRRVWWGEGEARWTVDGYRVKSTELILWWTRERWPADWRDGIWYRIGDRLEAQLWAGQLWVRRTLLDR